MDSIENYFDLSNALEYFLNKSSCDTILKNYSISATTFYKFSKTAAWCNNFARLRYRCAYYSIRWKVRQKQSWIWWLCQRWAQKKQMPRHTDFVSKRKLFGTDHSLITKSLKDQWRIGEPIEFFCTEITVIAHIKAAQPGLTDWFD